MKTLFKKIYRKWHTLILRKLDKIQSEIERNRMLIVQSRIREFLTTKIVNLADTEFQVFSQWGEDGIIQYLISKIPIRNKIFIEFGVQDYCESNTRFLLMNNNWSGLVIDCDHESVESIRSTDIYRRFDLNAVCEFITRDNINLIITKAGISGDIGLLSIDIDGNDYWIWEAITADVISPSVVVVEYNSVLGKQFALTIPYIEKFNRNKAHYPNLYYGASLKALCVLAEKKGYVFVGSNSAGNNAFFVRKDLADNIMKVDCESGYVESKFREPSYINGKFMHATVGNRLKLIENEIVIDVVSREKMKIKDL